MTGNTANGFGTRGGRNDRRTDEASDVATDGGELNDEKRGSSALRSDGGELNEVKRVSSDLQSDGGSAAVESLTDPARLAGRDNVDHAERTYEHEDPDHCEADAIGRAVVGVTNEDGEVLLLVRNDESHAILPNCVVDDGGDWAAVARRTVEESTGLRVELDAVEAVRTVEHAVEADGETRLQNTTRHVLFGASPVAPVGDRNDPAVTDDSEWTAGWYADLPVEVDEEGDVIDDIRAFVE